MISRNPQQTSWVLNENSSQYSSTRTGTTETKKKWKLFGRRKSTETRPVQQRKPTKIDGNQALSLLESFIFKKAEYQSYAHLNIDPTIYLNDYSMVSNSQFKEKFLSVFDDDVQRQHWSQLFYDENIVTFTRQLTQAMNKLTYLHLQYDQWTYYHQLGLTEGIWHGRVSKKMAMVNAMCVSYGQEKEFIQQRRSYFQDEIVKCIKELETCEKQTPMFINLFELQHIVHRFVEQDQYRLRIELERQRQMLSFDAQDHHLVKSFYQLNLKKDEMTAAKTIWKATHCEQLLRCELVMFRKWISLPGATMSMYTFMELGLHTMKEIFTNILTTKTLNRTVSTFGTSPTSSDQLVSESMIETVNLMEENIQACADIAHEEQQKILSKYNKIKKTPSITNVLQAIYVRQENMIRRAQYFVEQSIKMIFPHY